MVNNRKDWNDIKSNDSWSIFKIMSEFVEAYDRMAKIGHVFRFLVQREPKKKIHIINWALKLRKTFQKRLWDYLRRRPWNYGSSE